MRWQSATPSSFGISQSNIKISGRDSFKMFQASSPSFASMTLYPHGVIAARNKIRVASSSSVIKTLVVLSDCNAEESENVGIIPAIFECFEFRSWLRAHAYWAFANRDPLIHSNLL